MSSPELAQSPPATESTPSTGDGAQDPKHASIQLSLELERQLELDDSPPQTPNALASTHSLQQDQHNTNEPLDPQVLAHIVAGLRKTVDDMTKERNDLLKLLDGSTTREASLQDTLQLMTEKATDYEEQLSAAKKKIKQDEEDISLLRHKVEESRRGLMRLQTESRRQSAAPGALDLSRANIPGFSGPPSSKRASFTPLTGRSSNGHRRVSSISVDGSAMPELSPTLNGQAPSSFHDLGLAPPSGSRRSLFKYSPPTSDHVPLPAVTPPASPETDALKKEVEGLKKELSDTRMELAEASEGKEASEMCVQALRSFIEENQVGENGPQDLGLKLPPPPCAVGNDAGEESKKATASAGSGWAFKLWKGDNTAKPPPPAVNTTVPPASSSPATSPSSVASVPTLAATASAPFSRLGGFFSSRTSTSSAATTATTTNAMKMNTTTTTDMTTTTSTSPSSSLQTNAAVARPTLQRDSISGRSVSVSDTSSSFVEPLSPRGEEYANVVRVAGGSEDGVDDDDGEEGMESVKKDGMTESALSPSAVVVG